MGLIVDIVEPQGEILFITGYISQTLSVHDTFTNLSVYMPAKKQKHQPKRLSSKALSLTVASIIVEGEPHNSIPSDTLGQIGLTGDIDRVLQFVKDHHWHESNGRYHLPRKETRFIELSGE